jgi:hypothetical protein
MEDLEQICARPCPPLRLLLGAILLPQAHFLQIDHEKTKKKSVFMSDCLY